MPAAIETWRKRLPDFRYVTALGDESGPADGVFKGFVHDALLADSPAPAGHELFCCARRRSCRPVRDAAV